MLPIIDRGFNRWTLPLVDINVHQVGILTLVESYFHHWILPLVERNVYQGLTLVEIGNQSLPLVESGDQGPMDPSEHVCIPLVERYWWKLLHVCLPYKRDWRRVPLFKKITLLPSTIITNQSIW